MMYLVNLMGWLLLIVWLLGIPVFFKYIRNDLKSRPWVRFLELVFSLIWPIIIVTIILAVIFSSGKYEDEIISGDRENIG